MPKKAVTSSLADIERTRRYREANRGFLSAQQSLVREVARSTDCIERLRGTLARMEWDVQTLKPGAEKEMHDALYGWNKRQLGVLEANLGAERAALDQLRLEHARALSENTAGRKEYAQAERARRYREAHRGELAAKARERRASARLARDIFS